MHIYFMNIIQWRKYQTHCLNVYRIKRLIYLLKSLMKHITTHFIQATSQISNKSGNVVICSRNKRITAMFPDPTMKTIVLGKLSIIFILHYNDFSSYLFSFHQKQLAQNGSSANESDSFRGKILVLALSII